MIQRQPTRMLILTPKGTVVVARRLFDRLEIRLQPDDLGLLRDFEWWVRLSELINGIECSTPARHREVQR